MAFLSQASHLGSLLLPHDAFQEHAADRRHAEEASFQDDAFQEHAAHLAEWSATLRSKGSERTCLRSGLPTFLHCACTAHPNYVVKDAAAHRKPPEARICRLRNQS